MNKQELIALTQELLEVENLDDRAGDLQFLRREYKHYVTREEDTLFEQEETNKFLALFNELAKREPKLLSTPYEGKKKIIEAARKLLEKSDVLAANKELDRLSDAFRKEGRCANKEQDDELWNEFRQVKNEFYDKKRAYFAELDKANAEKRAKKEDIIERAKKVLEMDNIKDASAEMDNLRKEWKEVGYSGKGDDYLWKEFAKSMNDFQDKKKAHRSEMLKTFEERAAKKEEFIKNAKKLLADAEFTDEEVAKFKNLRKEFNAIGFAGKDKDDDLYKQLNEVIQKYFEEMKFYKF